MEFSKDGVDLIYQLLPGFVAAWIFYGLTAHPKAAPFERIVQAIIFTVFVKACMVALKAAALYVGAHWRVLGPWNDEVAFFNSVLVALLLGVIFARWANNNTIHGFLRENKRYTLIRQRLRRWRVFKWRLFGWVPEWEWTCRTSWPTEWYAAFRKLNRHYVVLHLKGGRRLHGFPLLWPDQPDKGNFALWDMEWLLDDGRRAPLYNVEHILIPVGEVEMVEFLKPKDDRSTSEEQLLAVQQLLISKNAEKLLKGESNGSNASTGETDDERADTEGSIDSAGSEGAE